MASIQCTDQNSASSIYRTSYDVFLSFRGEDTRTGFTSHLYNALKQRGVHTFIDDKLRRGEEISLELLKAIEESRSSIVVFSKNYASSSWCLDELGKILECRQSRKQIIWPVFYDVDPSEVRHQTGNYGEAMAKHEVKYISNEKKIQAWRTALRTVANLSGWHLKTETEAKFIQSIVSVILKNLNHTPLHIARYPVALDSRVNDMILLLDTGSNDVFMVGIHGIGGIGKTTIAKAVYNHISYQFEGCAFLANVREASHQFRGLVQLQETLLSDILDDRDWMIGNVDKGINTIRNRLSSKRVLIVLDDVDNDEQLNALAGGHDWFGPGSRIVVTTRGTHLLTCHGFDKLYKVHELDPREALQLFNCHAFKGKTVLGEFLELSERAIRYANGLPLALEVLGSFLYSRDKSEWECALEKLEETMNEKIHNTLKISYDGLDKYEQAIFLHIACFLKGKSRNEVRKILEACDVKYAVIGVRVLIDKSLVTVNERGTLDMHDLVQQMGWQIVQDESSEPGNRSRLCHPKEVIHVLTKNTGTSAVVAIKLDLSQHNEKFCFNPKAFKSMWNLKLVILHNVRFSGDLKYLPKSVRWVEWSGCESTSLPSNFPMDELVGLDMQRSFLKNLGSKFKNLHSLKYLNLSGSEFLTKIPDLSPITNLESLILCGCTNLVEIHDSVGCLDQLVNLEIRHCFNLMRLPSFHKLYNLRELVVTGCFKIEGFGSTSRIIETTSSSTSGHTVSTAFSLAALRNLRRLSISYCNLSNADFLETLPINGSKLHLLYLSGNEFTNLPSCISKHPSLIELDFNYCAALQEIPELPESLQSISANECRSLIRTQNCGDLLRSKRSKELDFVVRGSEIPDWISYTSTGSTISFNVPANAFEKWISLVTSVVVQPMPEESSLIEFSYSVSINGLEWGYLFHDVSLYSTESDTLWLHHLPCDHIDNWEQLVLTDCDQLFTLSFRSNCDGVEVDNVISCGVYLVGSDGSEITPLHPTDMVSIDDSFDPQSLKMGDEVRNDMTEIEVLKPAVVDEIKPDCNELKFNQHTQQKRLFQFSFWWYFSLGAILSMVPVLLLYVGRQE